MILTVCMSPCVDVTIELDSLNVGRVNIVRSKTMSYSGKAINVAIGLKHLGGDVYSTGFMYRENGEIFERALQEEGIPFAFVWNEGRVRENYKLIDKKSMLTEINDVGSPIKEGNLEVLLAKIRELSAGAEVTVISGGLPRGVDPGYYGEALRRVDPKSIKIVDAEGGKLASALDAEVDLVKPNLEELQELLGREFCSKADMLVGCRELIDRGAKSVLLSLGKEGAVITDGYRSYYSKTNNVAVNSTVGAGDAMVAAVALKMKERADMPEILRAGVAAGTASVTTFEATTFTKDKYEEIYHNLSVMEI